MAKLNTAIRGAQIADAVAGNGLEWTSDDVLGIDLKANDGLVIDGVEVTVDYDDSTIGIKTNKLAVKDAGITETQLHTSVAGDGLAGGGGSALSVDLNELSAAVVDVTNDSIAIVDANDSNASRKETIADLMTAVAGAGITATAGVLSADAITDNIVEDDILFENESDNCNGSQVEFTLSETPLANSVQVFLNGLIQEEGTGKDYLISGTTVTFVIAPASGDILLIYYFRDNAEV